MSIQTLLLTCCILEGVTGLYTGIEEEMGGYLQGMWGSSWPYQPTLSWSYLSRGWTFPAYTEQSWASPGDQPGCAHGSIHRDIRTS